MLFTDSLFIFGLILLFFVYFLIPQKFRWMLLLAASIAFYAYSGWTNLLYIGATAVTTFFVTKRIEKMAAAAKDAVSAHKSEWSRDEKKAFKEAERKSADAGSYCCSCSISGCSPSSSTARSR